MGRNRYTCGVDRNHVEIKQAYEKLGCSVVDLARVGGGCPDLLLGLCGLTFLSETKTADGRVDPRQDEWSATWRGALKYVVRSTADVLTVVTQVRALAAKWAAACPELTISPVESAGRSGQPWTISAPAVRSSKRAPSSRTRRRSSTAPTAGSSSTTAG